MGRLAHSLLHEPHIRERRAVHHGPFDVPQPLKRLYPESFAIENMDRLIAHRGKTKAGYFPHIIAAGKGGYVIQKQVEAGMCPALKFTNPVNSEHWFLLSTTS